MRRYPVAPGGRCGLKAIWTLCLGAVLASSHAKAADPATSYAYIGGGYTRLNNQFVGLDAGSISLGRRFGHLGLEAEVLDGLQDDPIRVGGGHIRLNPSPTLSAAAYLPVFGVTLKARVGYAQSNLTVTDGGVSQGLHQVNWLYGLGAEWYPGSAKTGVRGEMLVVEPIYGSPSRGVRSTGFEIGVVHKF